MTAIFLYVILAVTDARNEHPALAPAAIGLALTMIHFASITAHRHLGQPGPLDRRRSLRRQRRDHPALAVHPGAAARRRDRRLHLPADLRPRHRPGAGLGAGLQPGADRGRRGARVRRAGPVPAGVEPADRDRAGRDPAAATEQAAWEQEPIIQDGWQWDHAAQEWKPLEQWQPAPPAAARRHRPAGLVAVRARTPARPRSVRRSDRSVVQGRSGPAARAPATTVRRALGRDLRDQSDPAGVGRPRRRRPASADCWSRCRRRPSYRPAGVVSGLVEPGARAPGPRRPPVGTPFASRRRAGAWPASPARPRRRPSPARHVALATEPPDVARAVLGVVVGDLRAGASAARHDRGG